MTNLEKAEQYLKEEKENEIGIALNVSYVDGHKRGVQDFARWLDQEENKTIQNPKEICNQIVQSTILGEIRCVNKKPCFLHDISKDQQEDKKEEIGELKESMDSPKGQWYEDMIDKINEVIKVLNEK